MSVENMIPEAEFCANHQVEISFIRSIQQLGLIEITIIEETRYINEDQLNVLEKIIRMHNELDINLEGIETVFNLLQRIEDMQGEITALRNRLRLYE